MQDDCKNCDGHGEVSANGSIQQCPVCDGYGFVGHIFSEDPPLSLKQGITLWVICAAVILAVILIGKFSLRLT